MQAIIEPGFIAGRVTPPPSKSITQRAYACALLRKGMTTVHHAGTAADELAMLEAIKALGATVTATDKQQCNIHSNGLAPYGTTVNCGESGLATRLLLPICAMSGAEYTLTGKGTLMNRSLQLPLNALQQLGITLHQGDSLPMTVKGPIVPKSIAFDCGGSAQLLSGLLIALCHTAEEKITIEASGLESRPYVDLTLDMLQQFGYPVTNTDDSRFVIDPQLFMPKAEVSVSIEKDWSSASFALVAGAIAGNMVVNGLRLDSLQADAAVLNVLRSVGVRLIQVRDMITVEHCNLLPFEFDASACPDLFPILAVLAGCCIGDSNIYGVHRLFHKESNRVASIAEMLLAFGIPFSVDDDAFSITGVDSFHGCSIDTYNDHRIAMAAAVGALRAADSVTLDHTDCVKKSYPGFFRDMILSGMVCKFSDAS